MRLFVATLALLSGLGFFATEVHAPGAIDCTVFLTKGDLINKVKKCGLGQDAWFRTSDLSYSGLCRGNCTQQLLSDIGTFVTNCRQDIVDKPDTVGRYYQYLSFWEASLRSMCVIFSGTYCMPSIFKKLYTNVDVRTLMTHFNKYSFDGMFDEYYALTKDAPLVYNKPEYCLPCGQKMLGQLVGWQMRNDKRMFPQLHDDIDNVTRKLTGLCGENFVKVAKTAYSSDATLALPNVYSYAVLGIPFILLYAVNV
jgi:hypothetical protein